jgi:hypothetical protein
MLVVSVKNYAKTTLCWSPSSSRSERGRHDSIPYERDNNLTFLSRSFSTLLLCLNLVTIIGICLIHTDGITVDSSFFTEEGINNIQYASEKEPIEQLLRRNFFRELKGLLERNFYN